MLFMKKALFDMKAIFEQKINEDRKHREDLVKSRIASFYDRHLVPGHNAPENLQNERIRASWAAEE
jgi:hypothetical protein